jgi:hypothetical protein
MREFKERYDQMFVEAFSLYDRKSYRLSGGKPMSIVPDGLRRLPLSAGVPQRIPQ